MVRVTAANGHRRPSCLLSSCHSRPIHSSYNKASLDLLMVQIYMYVYIYIVWLKSHNMNKCDNTVGCFQRVLMSLFYSCCVMYMCEQITMQ